MRGIRPEATRRHQLCRIVLGLASLLSGLNACGGQSNEAAVAAGGAPASAGAAAYGGASQGGATGAQLRSICGAERAAPRIDFEPHCAGVGASLGPSEGTLKEVGEPDSATGLIPHRFDVPSPFDCGYDTVIWLPGLTFSPIGKTFRMTTWWLAGSATPTRQIAVVLRDPDDTTEIALAVGVADALDYVTLLTDPQKFQSSAFTCPGSEQTHYLVPQTAPRDGCTDPDSSGLLRCQDLGNEFLSVSYASPASSDDLPVVYGLARWLSPL